MLRFAGNKGNTGYAFDVVMKFLFPSEFRLGEHGEQPRLQVALDIASELCARREGRP